MRETLYKNVNNILKILLITFQTYEKNEYVKSSW